MLWHYGFMGQEEYQELSSFLKRFIRRFKFLQGIEGLCLTTICALLLFAAGPGVNEIKNYLPYAPLVYSVLTGVVLLVAIGWTLYRLMRGFTPEGAAVYIEKKQPTLRNNLINSLQLYPQVSQNKDGPGFSSSMVLALLRSTRKQIATLKVDELLDKRPLNSSMRMLGIVFVPVLAMVLFNPSWVSDTFSLLTRPLDHIPPSKTELDVSPKGLRVVRGAPVTIQVATSGAIPKTVDLIVWSQTDDKGQPRAPEKLTMENLGDGKFKSSLARLEKTLHYRAASGDFTSPTYSAEAVDPPEIGNLQATIHPPAYSGLASSVNPGGNVEGLKGSAIRLDADTTKPVAKAELVTDDGKRLPLKIDGKKIQANFILFGAQQYRIEIEDDQGFKNAPITYELRVKPDGFPTIELLSPTEDMEINGDEVIVLDYSARDDFGIGEINLVAKVGDREDKTRLHKDETKRLILRDQHKWDLSRLALREDEEAVVTLQILDNDTISGPKIGVSRVLRLRLKNLKGEHKQVAEMIKDLNTRMVDLLGDHLERPLPNDKNAAQMKDADQKFDKNLADALKRVEDVLARTQKDRMSDFATYTDLEALKRNLEFTKNDLLQRQQEAASEEDKHKAHDEIASELERMSLLSEDISKRLKAQEAASAAQDLARSQERLMDSLEKLQSGDKNLDAIMKQISELQKTLAALQQALSQMAQQMPDDFMNADQMRGLGFDEMQSQLDAIRKKLQQGDIEGARQLARELFNQMAQMVASLQNMQRQQMASSMGRMQGEMQRQQNELQQLAQEQQEILLDTERVNTSAMRERDNALKGKLDAFLDKAIKELGALTELFPDREGPDTPDLLTNLDDATMNALLKNLIAKLLNKDFPGYGEGDKMTRGELGKKRTSAQESRARRAENSLNDIKSELDKLLVDSAQALSDADRRRVRDLAQRQDALRQRTDDLHEKLESLFQLFPSLDPKILQNIGEAGKSMAGAKDRLGQLDSRGAVPPEQAALERLSQSQQQMQSAMQQMAQRGQMGNMPVTRLFRQGGRFLPFGNMTPLPGMPQFPDFDIQSGFTGMDTEKFRLPGKEDYKAPRNFREEILESLKQGVPPQMKEQIERYFKNLSE